jgi:hypothetical protein
MTHLIYGDGATRRQVQLVTIAGREGQLVSGWIPAGLVEFPDDCVVIAGAVYTVLVVGPAVDQPTNVLPRWLHARAWIDPADQCA